MDEIRLKSFRCFRDEQTARLAPLTLLVGENSTGKTSFMAAIRALWDVASLKPVPDFKENPYDLGSFDEIAHYRGGGTSRLETIEAGFVSELSGHDSTDNGPCDFDQAEQESGPDFVRLSNALSALYPRASDEKRPLDAMLLAVPAVNA